MPSSYSLVPGGSDVDSVRGFTTLTILDQPEVPCAVVRADNVTMTNLPNLFDPVFRTLPTALAGAERSIVAPALASYFRIGGMDSEHATTDMAVGFPIDAPLQHDLPLGGTGLTATTWTTPGGRVAALSHFGPYDTLQQSWQQLLATLAERGLSPTPPFWEVYVTAPEPSMDPATLRTDLFVSLLHTRRG